MSEPASTTPAVFIYGAEWCVWCPRVKEYLDQQKVPYTYRDIEESGVREEVEKKLEGPLQGVPVIDIGGKMIFGFDINAINHALGREN